MKELLEYRISLIDRLVAATEEFCAACFAANDVYEPLTQGEWSIHQVAVHVRDIDHLVYGLRARRTMDELNPEFQTFDGDTYMAKHYSADEPLSEVLAELRSNIYALAAWLRTLPVEAWSRESRHATLGSGLTLQSWVERDLAHIEEHLAIVKR